MIYLNNGVEVNQNTLASTPVLTVDNNTSNNTSSFYATTNNQPTLTVVQDNLTTSSATPVLVSTSPVVVAQKQETTVSTGPVIATNPITIEPSNSLSVNNSNNGTQNEKKVVKKGNDFIVGFLFFVIVCLSLALFYTVRSSNSRYEELKYSCGPLKESNEGTQLDINSTLVQSLYGNVYTSIREDYAEPQFNDTMKLYLAYRKITDFEKYDSNCNMFDNSKMEPYVCNNLNGVKPKAFSLETLKLKWKTLFGEETPMPLKNIRLSNLCIGGYQYIPEREEFVEGYCKNSTTVNIRADKKIVSAVSYNSTISITENVRYYGQEKSFVPDYLKSGDYIYLFRLDKNYNYVLISKSYVQKY